jgi:hypothetical protein
MERLIASLGRPARQRTTLYGVAETERHHRALGAAPLLEPVYRSAGKKIVIASAQPLAAACAAG